MTVDYNLEVDYGWLLDAALSYGDSVGPDELQHFGVLGMKWGHHKAKVKAEMKGLGPESVTKTTKYGEKVTISKNPPGGIAKVLGLMSAKYRKHYNEMAYLTIKDASGKSVGNASVWKKGSDELYLNWLGINSSARGKGYASAVMQASTEYGKAEGLKKLTLEVPGKSPDARHIYEKLGFVATKEPTAREAKADTVWGGLTSMEYDFSKIKHSESESMDTVDDFLKHYGVPGMKWGKHKARKEPLGRAPGLTANQHSYNMRMYGKKSAKNINVSVHAGATVKEARATENKRRRKVANRNAALIVGGMAAVRYGPTIARVAELALNEAVLSKQRSNGQKMASRLLSETHGITNYSTIRMQQNPTTGHWL